MYHLHQLNLIRGKISKNASDEIDIKHNDLQFKQLSNFQAEMEREAAYFARLEKKEMMEEKMSSTKEIVCDVVSCKQVCFLLLLRICISFMPSLFL